MTEGALVLEGGSLRCVFTSAILDRMLEEEIEFSYVNGVSAGTMAAMNYLSRQKGRMFQVNRDYLHDKRYMSMRNLFRDRYVFNFDFVFGELSQELLPFDYDTFFKTEQKFEAVATRCKTGKPEYFEKSMGTDIVAAVKASSSMPVLSRMVDVRHRKYLDGGVSMPIAYQRAIDLGYEKVVLVLTREHGYRKKPYSYLKQKAYARYFGPLPEFLNAFNDVPDRYNRMQEEIDKLEAEGRIFVIRPEYPVAVSRLEQDVKKLEVLYEQGREVAKKRIGALKEYLKN